MVSITIRDVPEDIRDALAFNAESCGMSLESYLLEEIVSLAGNVPADVAVERAMQRLRKTGTTLAVEEIIEARDADRR